MTTNAQHTERPWRQRSELYAHESEIRGLRAEGYSLAQILRLLNLPVHRSTLHRWLRRVSADAAACPAAESAPAASPAALGATDSTEAAADDAAAEALLALSNFTPPSRKSR